MRDTASGVPDTTDTLCPIGTRTGTGAAFTVFWPVADTWVVMGLKMPAGFWVTIVLVPVCTRVTPPAVGEMRAGRGVLIMGPAGRKETAAIDTLAELLRWRNL